MLKDFKCYEDKNYFSFPGLTLLCGTNNSGKSSLLQSIYLLTQNAPGNIPVLLLNSHNFKMGSFSDILYKKKANRETIEFNISFDENILIKNDFKKLSINLIYKNPATLKYIPYTEGYPVLTGIDIKLQVKEEIKSINIELIDVKDSHLYRITGDMDRGYTIINGLVLSPIIYLDTKGKEKQIPSNEYGLIREYLELINTMNIHYLKAYRVDNYIHSHSLEKSTLGITGEYTAEVIGYNWNLNVDYYASEGNPVKFSYKFNEWIKTLLGEEYYIEPRKELNGYQVILKDEKNNFKFELFQVGFGISQLLPILTLLLLSKKNDVILVENPEIHFHPKLQAELVDLFIFAMEANRKLIIETHSEHLINRIRLRIKERNELKEKINIYFFEKDEFCKYQEIEIDDRGNIDYWPKDFFDQSYNDLMGLIK
jgi:predicted ATPase